MKFNPNDVDLNDGFFEVLLIKKPHTVEECGELLDGLINKNFESYMFDYLKASEMTITADSSMSWSLDGEEHVADKVVHITNLHSKMTLVK